MSRSVYKKGRKQNRKKFTNADFFDTTLKDFSNSHANSGRVKKSERHINQIVKEVKQLHLLNDYTWEKKLNMGQALIPKMNDYQEIRSKKKNLRSHTSKSIDIEHDNNDQSGVDYPIDVWLSISKYIKPEDVGNFAAINKTTLAVISLAEFWFSLYKRYFRNVPDLPQRLHPECMNRKYGLRTNVIKALYYMYPPFVEKLKPLVLYEGAPHKLIKRCCVSAWSQKLKNHWIFSFKLALKQKISRNSESCEDEDTYKPNLMEFLEDITANVDENCKVLQVMSSNYIILPMLCGQILDKVIFNPVKGLQYYKLQLDFRRQHFRDSNDNSMIIEPVVNLRVLDWWHPSFPSSSNIDSSLFATDSKIHKFEEIEF